MFFSAYVGTDVGLPRWREALAQHARHLGLQVHIEERRLGDRRTLALGWLQYAPAAESRGRLQETEQQVVAATLVFDGMTPGEANGATLTASLARAEIRVAVPAASTQQVCYARTPHGYVFADDLRLFPRLMDVDLDERAVYALFRYGVFAPGVTLYKQVQRIPNGHQLRLSPAAGEPVCTATFRWSELHPDGEGPGARSPEQWVAETLDGLLARVPASAVLLFSGGVDSSLMAARLSRLGRKDVQLLNYCFGPEDEEGRLALRIAARLGLECHQVHHDVRTAGDVLARVAKDYSVPFGDLSVFPTNVLVHEARALAGASRTVVDGMGADGAFDMWRLHRKWRLVYRVPRPVRRWVDAAYRGLQLWKYRSRLEGAARLLSRSTRMSRLHAAVAQNALERIAYTIPDDVEVALEQAVETSVEVLSTGAEVPTRHSLLELMWVTPGQPVQKAFDPLRARGIRPFYPFLQPAMVSFSSVLSWEVKYADGQDKALLKRLLARDLPPEWVYRPKVGFTRPPRATFAQASVQEFLHEVVLSPRNVLLDYCKPEMVRQLVERSRQHALGDGVYSFLCVLMFTAGWLHQLPSDVVRAPAPAPAPESRLQGVPGTV